jgi:hypothetical protein
VVITINIRWTDDWLDDSMECTEVRWKEKLTSGGRCGSLNSNGLLSMASENYPTPGRVVIFEKSVVTHTRNFPSFAEPEDVLQCSTKDWHWSLSWAWQTQSTLSNLIYLRPILMLFFHLRPGLPTFSFLQAFGSRYCRHLSHPYSCYTSRPSHSTWSDCS